MTKTVSVTPEIKGWCPGALRPMMSGDGLVVRVRPRGGRLSCAQMRGLAALASQFGNGLIDLSARANVQLRGVTEAGHPSLVDGLRDLDLIDETTATEARRNITITPFWTEGDGIAALAAQLTAALSALDAPQTPGKFGYAIDCGPVPVLRGISADIRIEALTDGGLLLRADGCETGEIVTPRTAADRALALARWFLESGGTSGGRGRMAAHLTRVRLPAAFTGVPMQSGAPLRALPGPMPPGYMAGFEFGQLQADTLHRLADIGPVRITPWRMVLIEGAATAPDLPDLITRPDDARLRVIACSGAPACPQALAATRPLARILAGQLPVGTLLHVSGCAKGCAHPGPALQTLVATVGGQFDQIRAGTARDTPIRRGLSPDELCANPSLLTE